MSKPLIISDCDEVLLHMVVPFGEWLNETQGVSFKLVGNDFSKAIRNRDTGEPVEPAEIWRLLNGFFDNEMHRQTPIAGAVGAINAQVNAVVFAEGSIDRSPCGTGTSARMALLHAQGLMGPGDELENHSLLDTVFRGTVEGTTEVGGRPGILPRIAGSAWITGFNQFVLEPDDPFAEGFLI